MLELRSAGDALALHLVEAGPAPADHDPAPAVSHLDHIEHVLASLSAPIPRRELRRACRMRDSALSDALGQLLTAGRVLKSPAGYHLAPPSSPTPFPAAARLYRRGESESGNAREPA